MTVPTYDHIVVVIMENHDLSEIIGNSQAPYINSLAAGGALLTNYSDVGHPSEPNYFALYAGSTFGVNNDGDNPEPDPTLATILESAGKTFAGYVETGASDMNHNPWEYFPEGTSVERDFGVNDFNALFPSDNFSSLPTVSFVIPNLNDDMHNGTIAQGDTWLQTNINGYAQWAKANNSLLIVTWDEGDTGDQVPAILYGAGVVPGQYNTAYDHYNMLSTILAAYKLAAPNNAATASPINVFAPAPCFAAGTRIVTVRGEVAVEDLRIGDVVVTLSGKGAPYKPVRWIGERRVDIAAHPRPDLVRPIRIAANAFGDGMPLRDLVVSPDHAVFVDGVLINAGKLVNGVSIAQDVACSAVHYFHVELDAHDILLADGMPAESYLDTGNRAQFSNGPRLVVLYPDFAPKRMQTDACVPFVEAGPILTALRERLIARVAARGWQITTDPALHFLVNGQLVRRGAAPDGLYRFDLPDAVRELRIVSRTYIPAGACAQDNDLRRLGVCLAGIAVTREGQRQEIALDHPALRQGFLQLEYGGGARWRWTDGDARLPVELFGEHAGGTLELRLLWPGSYWTVVEQRDTALVRE